MNIQSVQPLALFLGDCLRAEGGAPLREKLVIQACPSRSSFHPQPTGNVRGPTIYELVRAVYRRNYVFPHPWLAHLVGKDAASMGHRR